MATRAEKICLKQLCVVRTLQCLVKGEALVSPCPGHAAIMRLVEGAIHSENHNTTSALKYGPLTFVYPFHGNPYQAEPQLCFSQQPALRCHC